MDDVVRLLEALSFPLWVLTAGLTGKILANVAATMIDALTRMRVLAVGKQYVPLRQSKDILSARDTPGVFSPPGLGVDVPERTEGTINGSRTLQGGEGTQQ